MIHFSSREISHAFEIVVGILFPHHGTLSPGSF